MPYSRENSVHILFFIWWVSSPLLHPNWHQFTLGYANPGLWVIRAVIPPPRDKNHCGSCVKLCCHRLTCQACVWWLSFIQHPPRVSFIFILQLHLVLSRDVRGSPSSHLFEMRPRLTGGDHGGSFFFIFWWNITSLSELFVCAVPSQHLPFRQHAESAGPATQFQTNTQMQQLMALRAFLATLNDGLIARTLLHSDKAALWWLHTD